MAQARAVQVIERIKGQLSQADDSANGQKLTKVDPVFSSDGGQSTDLVRESPNSETVGGESVDLRRLMMWWLTDLRASLPCSEVVKWSSL